MADVGTVSGIAIQANDGNGGTASLPSFAVTVSALNVTKAFGVANQGGTYDAASVAGNAIDGLDTTINHTTCDAATDWWQVELPNPTQISKIIVRNRTSWQSRLNGSAVYVTDAPYTAVPADTFKVATLTGASGDQNVTFTTPKSGAYVIIKAANGECLHMREVEVYGKVPDQPTFAQSSYIFRTRATVPVGEQVGKISVKDWQNDPVSLSIVGNAPFAVDSTGKLTANGPVQPGMIYNFAIQATDGLHPATVPVTVEVTSSDALSQALRTGVVAGVTQEEMKLDAMAFVSATKNTQQQALNSIFKLAVDGSVMADSITGITWDPATDSAFYDTLDPVENFPLIISNASTKNATSANKNLAIAGIKDNGARYAVLADNPLHDLTRTTEPGGTANTKMNDLMKSLVNWLVGRDVTTGAFKVVVAHLPDTYWWKHDTTTRSWVTTRYPAATVNASDACESTLLANCLLGADLLIIGGDNGTQDNHGVPFDLAATMQAVKNAQANGIPVLFVNYDGNYSNDMVKYGSLYTALLDYFKLSASDNYWLTEKVANYNTTGTLDYTAINSILTTILTSQSPSLNFMFEAADCPVGGSLYEVCDPKLVTDTVTGLNLHDSAAIFAKDFSGLLLAKSAKTTR